MRFHNSPPVAKSKKLSTKLFGLCSDESIISHWMILNRYSLFCVYDVQMDMYRLAHAMERGERIELTSKYFSKKLLYALYEEGAFAPNKYNRYDGTNNYQFMLDMFNKRNKSEITEQQHRKIRGLIAYSIKPFLRERLKYK